MVTVSGPRINQRIAKGLTLSELLIGLAIIGMIAALTIPKIIQASQSQQLNANARDAMTLVSGAYADFETENAPATSTTFLDLLSYLTFSRNFYGQSAVTVDPPPNGTNITAFGCSGSTCTLTAAGSASAVRLKSGAVVVFPRTISFSATTGNVALPFLVDPDGERTGTANSVEFWLYVDGTIKSLGNLTASTVNSAGTFSAIASGDPSYLNF